jgi:hypothetical protein
MKVILSSSGKVRMSLSANEFAALQLIVVVGFKDALAAAATPRLGFAPFADGLNVTDDRSDAPKRPAPAGFGRPKAA